MNGNSHVTTRIIGTYGYAAPEYVATGNTKFSIHKSLSFLIISSLMQCNLDMIITLLRSVTNRAYILFSNYTN